MMVVYGPTMTTARPTTTTMREQRTKPDRAGAPAGLVWIKCPYEVVTLGLKQTLEAAGYACWAQQKPPVGKPPSCVICCPSSGEDVASEVKSLREQAPGAPILIFGLHLDQRVGRAAFRAEASGYVHGGMQPAQIVQAVSLVAAGEVVIPEEVLKGLVEEETSEEGVSVLTPRQREILALVAEGQTNAEIARRLYLSEFTIKQHLRHAYKTLKVRNRTEAARLWSGPDF